MVWLSVALLCAIVLLALAWPLAKLRAASLSRSRQELAVLRDRLTETQREVEQGLLSPEEAKSVEVEISRQILNLVADRESRDKEAGAAAPGISRKLPFALIALVPAGALALYALLGSPGEPGQPFAGEQASGGAVAQHDAADLGNSMTKLAERLKESPEDIDGWILLARSYAATGQYQAAVDAFGNALKLAPDNLELRGTYGETLVTAMGGIVTPEALEHFTAINKAVPGDKRSRYYLGLAAAQSGRGREALDVWLALQSEAAADAPWLPALQARIRQVSEEYGIDVASQPAPVKAAPRSEGGPTAEQVAAMQALPADEQANMIRSMVARLADRLADEPEDIEGWLRLARSYRVLGGRGECQGRPQTGRRGRRARPPPISKSKCRTRHGISEFHSASSGDHARRNAQRLQRQKSGVRIGGHNRSWRTDRRSQYRRRCSLRR